ncbi:MAG: DUF805 domain-containing protein [Pseudobdellovibrionaceae bacterium]
MNIVESVKTCFSKYAVFEGRAKRSEFWWFFLFQAIIMYVIAPILDGVLFPPAMAQTAADVSGQMMQAQTDMANIAMAPAGPTPILNSITGLALLCPSIAVATRRLHDVNKSGWWQLISLTIIGIIPLIYWLAKAGDETDNRFGKPV